MTDKAVFHSSFDSTRYTGDDRRPAHPNLAQAQTEALTSLLLGRSLVVNNTYAFDSGSVLNLIGAILTARDRVRTERMSESGRQRVDEASPVILRWFGKENFFACCADQLRRLEPGKRFILSHWKAIDGNDEVREILAAALTSDTPQLPDAIREYDHLAQSFDTLIKFEEYCRRQVRAERARDPKVRLDEYLRDFEEFDRHQLQKIIDGMDRRYRIDIDKAVRLQESISKVNSEAKGARGWAHDRVDKAGGELSQSIDPFLLEQRQLVDTLYNGVLADSAGSDHDLLSSVPRTVGWANLEQANSFALELIKHVKAERLRERSTANDRLLKQLAGSRNTMSDVFVATTAEPELESPPLQELLVAYWRLVADDDRWFAWRDSCDQLEYALLRAQRLRLADRPPDSRLSDAWDAHLDTLQGQLTHVRAEERALAISVDLDGQGFETKTEAPDQRKETGSEGTANTDSLAAGQYIDRFLRGVFR